MILFDYCSFDAVNCLTDADLLAPNSLFLSWFGPEFVWVSVRTLLCESATVGLWSVMLASVNLRSKLSVRWIPPALLSVSDLFMIESSFCFLDSSTSASTLDLLSLL